MAEPPELRRKIATWLFVVSGLVVAMVAVGGITRLTNSGLSIVEWKPIMGAVPPLSDAEWAEAFTKYRQYPQFLLSGGTMTLAEFKGIFFWEYVHRLLGRFIGLAYFVPFVWLVVRHHPGRPLVRRLLVAGGLGALQGALGWFMVKSGLVDMPRVSHYRLALHLLTALGLLAYLLWLAFDLRAPGPESSGGEVAPSSGRLQGVLRALAAVLVVQITYGAFTAGLRAGYGYPTWPTMNGAWVPPYFFHLDPAIRNFVENPPAVQFLHRTIAWACAGLALYAVVIARRQGSRRPRSITLGLFAAVCAQFALGIATVLFSVPVAVATVHQVGAFLVFVLTLYGIHATRGVLPAPSSAA